MQILIFYIIPLLILGEKVTIKIKDENDEYLVYQNNKIEFEFSKSKLNQGIQCKPPKSFGVSNTNNNTKYSSETLRIINDDIVSFNVFVNQQTDKSTMIILNTEIESDEQILKPKGEMLFKLTQICPEKDQTTSKNYWTPITVEVEFKEVREETSKKIEFAMLFSCDKSFRDITFDWSLPILLIISTITIAFLAKHTRILSFRLKRNGQDFQGFEINFIVIGIYISLYAIGASIVISTDFSNLIRYFLIVISCTIGIFAIFFVSSELACLLKANSQIRKQKLIISAIISLLIGLPYYFFKPWYLSDLISLAFIFLIVKFFRFKNLQTASVLMISNILLDCTFAIYIHYTQVESYNTTILQYLNCPLELQLPLIHLQYDKNCAWISLFSQVIPGLFLSLAYRIDKSKRTFTYGLSGFLSLIISQCLWVLATVSVKHSIPQSLFTYPILLGVSILNALNRAEFQSFFKGDYFVDQDYYRIRGQSLNDNRQPLIMGNTEIICNSKEQHTDL